jgi:hypothetical protein
VGRICLSLLTYKRAIRSLTVLDLRECKYVPQN